MSPVSLCLSFPLIRPLPDIPWVGWPHRCDGTPEQPRWRRHVRANWVAPGKDAAKGCENKRHEWKAGKGQMSEMIHNESWIIMIYIIYVIYIHMQNILLHRMDSKKSEIKARVTAWRCRKSAWRDMKMQHPNVSTNVKGNASEEEYIDISYVYIYTYI